MGYDLKRSHFSTVLEKGVLTGSVITEEGVLLVSVLDPSTGTETVEASKGAATDVIAGFAMRDNADHSTTSVVETSVVPSGTGPFIVSLDHTLLVSSADTGLTTNIRVEDVTTPLSPTAFTLANAGPPAGGSVGVNPATGALEFNTADQGKLLRITYTYNLTVAESRQKFFQRNINNEASALFSQVGVGHGHGEIFTDAFDATVDWSVAGQAVTSGAAGTLTTGGSGVALDARVISVPNVNNPLLGIAFNIGGSAA